MNLFNTARLLVNVVGVSLVCAGSYGLYKMDENDIGKNHYCPSPAKPNGQNNDDNRRGSSIGHPGCKHKFHSYKNMYIAMILAGTTALVFTNLRSIEYMIFGCKDCAGEKIQDIFSKSSNISGRSL